MKVTITNLRQDLFRLVDKALDGEPLAFVYKGVEFKLVPETKSGKLEKLTAEPVVRTQPDLETSNHSLLAEMEAEWEKDWAEL